MGLTTTLYVRDNGYTIPKVFLNYSNVTLQKMMDKYRWRVQRMTTGQIMYDPERVKAYRNYIAWIRIRLKQLEMLEMIT